MGPSDVTLTAAAGTEGGGAALDQVIGMSVVALIVTVALLWIGYLHRNRRITWLNNFAEWLGRKFHRPPWVALSGRSERVVTARKVPLPVRPAAGPRAPYRRFCDLGNMAGQAVPTRCDL